MLDDTVVILSNVLEKHWKNGRIVSQLITNVYTMEEMDINENYFFGRKIDFKFYQNWFFEIIDYQGSPVAHVYCSKQSNDWKITVSKPNGVRVLEWSKIKFFPSSELIFPIALQVVVKQAE